MTYRPNIADLLYCVTLLNVTAFDNVSLGIESRE